MATIDLESHFLAATEAAAIAAAAWRGKGDGKAADGAAVEAMRAIFDEVPFDGRVAIGEGERDDAPMLWIGEPLGSMQGNPDALSIDIAVDPLECTNHVANDLPINGSTCCSTTWHSTSCTRLLHEQNRRFRRVRG